MTTDRHSWINSKGGEWSARENWAGGAIPNGPPNEWAQYTFKEARSVSGVELYWVDDGGGIRVPQSWRVLYREGDLWKPVDATGAYGVAKDQFNKVAFKPVKTNALKLEVKVQPDASAGVFEWRVK